MSGARFRCLALRGDSITEVAGMNGTDEGWGGAAEQWGDTRRGRLDHGQGSIS